MAKIKYVYEKVEKALRDNPKLREDEHGKRNKMR